MALQFVNEADLNDKRVIARFDFNVPLNKESGEITDTTRIDNALETIKTILDGGASKLILMSHLGRPKGEVKKEFSLEPVALYLAEKLPTKLSLLPSIIVHRGSWSGSKFLKNCCHIGPSSLVLESLCYLLSLPH